MIDLILTIFFIILAFWKFTEIMIWLSVTTMSGMFEGYRRAEAKRLGEKAER